MNYLCYYHLRNDIVVNVEPGCESVYGLLSWYVVCWEGGAGPCCIIGFSFMMFCLCVCSCTSCTMSDFPCTWCVQEHKCTNTPENCRTDILITGKAVSTMFPILYQVPCFPFCPKCHVSRPPPSTTLPVCPQDCFPFCPKCHPSHLMSGTMFHLLSQATRKWIIKRLMYR